MCHVNWIGLCDLSCNIKCHITPSLVVTSDCKQLMWFDNGKKCGPHKITCLVRFIFSQDFQDLLRVQACWEREWHANCKWWRKDKFVFQHTCYCSPFFWEEVTRPVCSCSESGLVTTREMSDGSLFLLYSLVLSQCLPAMVASSESNIGKVCGPNLATYSDWTPTYLRGVDLRTDTWKDTYFKRD